MKSFAMITAAVVITAVLFSSRCGADEGLPEQISFGQHIRPIFTAHCTACHGGVSQAGDVSFVYRQQVLPPDGWIVQPGNPEKSVLLDRVTSDDPDIRMPPPDHGAALSKTEVALLEKWIRQGANWDEHWAFVAPKLAPQPSLQNTAWIRQPLDWNVLSRLERLKIAPAEDALPERWLRRVTLDLIGLPPTLQERKDFLNDLNLASKADGDESGGVPKAQNPSSPNASGLTKVAAQEAAYQRVVDRLLASPHFGERWASVWLDQMRYADSKGLGLDGRRNIWKYRDWVIDALNRDLPYDQFTIKQIAGDLLPDATLEDFVATAAHRVTQSNEEGGTDDEEFRVAAVLDRVNTTWQTWQGITFGCVQCHHHPYDPFTHDEYYQFAAFFNNTSDSDLDEDWPVVQAPVNPADYAAASELDQQIAKLQTEIWQQEYAALGDSELWKPLVQLQASSNNATKVAVERVGDHDEYHTVDTVSRNADLTLEASVPDGTQRLTAVRFTALPLSPDQAVSDSELGFVLSHVEAFLVVPDDAKPQRLEFAKVISDEPHPFYDPELSLDEKSNRGFAAFTRIHYPRQAAFILKSPINVPPGASLRVTLKHRVYILAAFSLIAKRGHLAVSDSDRFTDLIDNSDLQSQRKQLADLQQRRGQIQSTSVPILMERPSHLQRPTHVFERGLFLTKAHQVKPGTPESFPPLPESLPRNRLALAHWLASPLNPLTARVAVNRLWARMFGIGLVETEEDFGSSGTVPSHPELLDSLAVRFQSDYGWSQKQVLREIALSRTYRQSASARPELQSQDPRNRLLARGPRHRLSAEIVRDQALAVAGLLSRKQFGAPVHPPIPDGVWMPFSGGDKWTTPDTGNDDRYRRSIYTYTKRSIPFPMFAAFDAPSREFCTPRRLPSNTPVQALMTLNDATFVECTAGLAAQMSAVSERPSEQIAHGFLLVTGREVRNRELEELLKLHEASTAGDSVSRLNQVASVLLNLDEFLSK